MGILSSHVSAQTIDSLKSNKEVKKSGFVNMTKIGYMPLSSFSAGTVNGFQYKERLMLGIGVNFDWYNNSSTYPYSFYSAIYYLPTYLDFRVFGDKFGKKKDLCLLGFIDAGPSFLLGSENGGVTSSPNYNGQIFSNDPPDISNTATYFAVGTGLIIEVDKESSVIFEFGIKNQNVNYIYNGTNVSFYNSSYTSTPYSEKRQTDVFSVFVNVGLKF